MPAQDLSSRSRTPLLLGSALIVGAIAGLISIARVLIVNRDALSTLLWAEDGAFPLCIRKASVLACWFDPYAGYLLTGPRLAAGLVAPWPLETWPLITNVLAALIAGMLSAWVCFITLRSGMRPAFAVLLSLAPVLAPIVGLEAVNAVGSMYIPLLYACSVVLVTGGRRLGAWPLAAMLLLTALTIPTAVLLVVAVLLLAARGRLTVRTALVGTIALAAGLVIQVVVILSSPAQRLSGVSWASIVGWVQTLPDAMLSLWPGLSSQGALLFERFPVPAFPLTGLVLLTAGLALSWRGWASRTPVGEAVALLIWLGTGFGLIPALLPSVSGSPGNRYFVPVVLLWAAALILWLASRSTAWPRWVPWAVLIGVIALWWPMFPASQFRHQEEPAWNSQVDLARAGCVTGDDIVVEFAFSPAWPHGDTVLHEPTTNRVSCADLAGVLR